VSTLIGQVSCRPSGLGRACFISKRINSNEKFSTVVLLGLARHTMTAGYLRADGQLRSSTRSGWFSFSETTNCIKHGDPAITKSMSFGTEMQNYLPYPTSPVVGEDPLPRRCYCRSRVLRKAVSAAFAHVDPSPAILGIKWRRPASRLCQHGAITPQAAPALFN